MASEASSSAFSPFSTTRARKPCFSAAAFGGVKGEDYAMAAQLWVQFDDATATVATDNNISLALSTLTVTAS